MGIARLGHLTLAIRQNEASLRSNRNCAGRRNPRSDRGRLCVSNFGPGRGTIMGRESRDEKEKKHFLRCIEQMEEDRENDETFTKEMPRLNIVKYLDLLDVLWGWDKLLPMGNGVSMSDYSSYLKVYHSRNANAIGNIPCLAQICLDKEKQHVSEWRIHGKLEHLGMIESIVLSCLIHKRVESFICTGSFSDVSGAALLCIAKEADLTSQLLSRGADPVDDFINLGRKIRMFAFSLMNCSSDNSSAASAVMLGMAREAEMMCAWMNTNKKPVDLSDSIPDEIVDSHIVRYETLRVMVNLLEESCAAAGHKIDKEGPSCRNGPGCDGDGITADGAENTRGSHSIITRGGISDVLNSHNKKSFEGGEKRKKRKTTKDHSEADHPNYVSSDLLEKLWGWETLLPLPGSVKLADDRRRYLEEYYKHNVSEFVSGACTNQNPEDLQIANNSYADAAVAKSCLKMEDKLLSEWKTRVRPIVYNTLAFSTIIQSTLIKKLALSICHTGGECFSHSDVAFACITNEADLMCELLKHGAEPFDDIIQQSHVIRICALGLANFKGQQSISPAALMVGIAKEAKKMCNWMKREKKLVTFSLSEPHDLEESRLIRIKALDVMTSILQGCSFPCQDAGC